MHRLTAIAYNGTKPAKFIDVMKAADIARAIERIAHEILETNHGSDHLLILGIPTRGPVLANRIVQKIKETENIKIPVGVIDVTMYRDDLRRRPPRPMGPSIIPSDLENKIVVLVDDVLFSGRTTLAALEAIKDLGRPTKILLAVLVDRGHHEVPIQADFIGQHIETKPTDQVKVHLTEIDNCDEVVIEGEKA